MTEARKVAERITNKLFVNGEGQKAERLVLELPGKRDGGGWCWSAVCDVIERELAQFQNAAGA
jgi:hypothetical protein